MRHHGTMDPEGAAEQAGASDDDDDDDDDEHDEDGDEHDEESEDFDVEGIEIPPDVMHAADAGRVLRHFEVSPRLGLTKLS